MRFSLLFCLLFSLAGLAAEKQIRISTGSNVYADILSKIGPDFEKATGIKIIYIGDPTATTTPTITMKAVLEKKADLGTGSIDIGDWFKAMEKTDTPVKDQSQITYRVIGRDILSIITHKDIKKDKLSLKEIEGLFSGDFKTWKSVAGSDTPVKIFLQEGIPTRRLVFKRKVLGDREFASQFTNAKDVQDLLSKVSQTPGAVSFIPKSMITSEVREIESEDPIGRPITFVRLGKPSEEVLKLENFIVESRKKL